jgi:hypothetical protein
VFLLSHTNEEQKPEEREARERETLLPITMALLPQQEGEDKENNHHHPLQQSLNSRGKGGEGTWWADGWDWLLAEAGERK